LESEGLVERKRRVLAVDKRAVFVVITRQGRELVRRMSDELAQLLAETEVMVKELNRLLQVELDPIADLDEKLG
jgi:DNA-binding MarR family transcriptional regulator